MKEVDSTIFGPILSPALETLRMNCDGCIFFESTDYGIDDAGVERAFGECHRYPPTPVQGSVSSGLRFAKFPRVADDTWCGDFQSRRGISRTELAHTRIEEANAAFDSVVHEDATDANCGANVAMCQSGSEGVTDRNILGTPPETKHP